MRYRVESDTMGEVRVPVEAYWGAQTQRALGNGIDVGRMPEALLRALVLLKKGAAQVNGELGLIPSETAEAIRTAADDVLAGRLGDCFPLSPFQTGSGTSTNMNVNEVLANRANELLGGARGAKAPVHPNDHVNRCQSSNDAFPTAVHVAAAKGLRDDLLPAARALEGALRERSRAFRDVVKLGRTHLMDALPLTLGQEFGAYARQVELGQERVRATLGGLLELPLGGTAVGTGVNAHPEFARRTIAWLAAETELPFVRAADPFEAQGARDACLATSGALRVLAVSLSKIANDLRWMASGPHGGLGELRLPELQPGSSIMPGKVNPVVPEAVLQAAAQVVGNDLAVTQGGLGGVLDLHLMMPLVACNLLHSVALLSGASRLLAEKCVEGIRADPSRCRELLEGSLALATPLASLFGYDATARVVGEAARRNIPLLQAAQELGVATEEELRRLLDPEGMVGHPGGPAGE
ncbi:MAG: class II fumarate hydratase [Deferrisomatales bacterium]